MSIPKEEVHSMSECHYLQKIHAELNKLKLTLTFSQAFISPSKLHHPTVRPFRSPDAPLWEYCLRMVTWYSYTEYAALSRREPYSSTIFSDPIPNYEIPYPIAHEPASYKSSDMSISLSMCISLRASRSKSNTPAIDSGRRCDIRRTSILDR
ncbi:hypothetical protein BCR34DRAFT_51246 [Clohesyomyces aquaticus]|uniref:Uncharacterized protein n=1 Tax=Clohesyomyces aquaticus TaxID=1231657 RepID=A0A1Y2A433_9PLEO|nr:hypothetical protein BCR34DRAFT_51246 [Clohesyomyces aquaticus]